MFTGQLLSKTTVIALKQYLSGDNKKLPHDVGVIISTLSIKALYSDITNRYSEIIRIYTHQGTVKTVLRTSLH
ncbi:hypothetical protein BDFB_010665, partial [Asbolus verrucosus]